MCNHGVPTWKPCGLCDHYGRYFSWVPCPVCRRAGVPSHIASQDGETKHCSNGHKWE